MDESKNKIIPSVPSQDEFPSPDEKELGPVDEGSRQKILDVGRRLFAVNGLEGTSTREIAKEAGLNVSLISYYFGGKEGLYRAVLLEFAEQTVKRVTAMIDQVDLAKLDKKGFVQVMRLFMAGMIPHKFNNLEINAILHREMLGGVPHAREMFHTIFPQIVEKVVGLYHVGQEKGFVRPDINPYVLFLSLVHATDVYLFAGKCCSPIEAKILQLPKELDLYVDQMFYIFVEGVLI